MSLTELNMALNPSELFRHCVGEPDKWQSDLLEAIARAASSPEEKRRFHLACARQSGKTEVCSIAAVWLCCYSPLAGRPVIICAPALRQAEQLLERVRLHLQCLPDSAATRIVRENDGEIELGNRGIVYAVPGGDRHGHGIRGFSNCAAIFGEEMARIADDVWQALSPMTAISNGIQVMLSTPFGRQNLFGVLDQSRPDDWHFTRVDATQNPRLTAAYLESEKRTIGKWRMAVEFFNSFEEGTEGSFFSPESIEAAFVPSSTIPPFRGGHV